MAKHAFAEQLASRTHLLERLQSFLLEEHANVTKEVCRELRFDMGDLRPKTRESFGAINVPADIKEMRFEHFEERRTAKLVTIGSEVLSRHPGLSQLSRILQHLGAAPGSPGKPQFKSFASETGNQTQVSSTAVYNSPLDKFRYCLDREKSKFEKAAKTYAAFIQQTEKDREELEDKMNKKAEREQRKALEARLVQEKVQAKINKVQAKREKIRAQKDSLMRSHYKEMQALGKSMEKRMSSSTARRRFHTSAYSFDRKSLDTGTRAQTASMSPKHVRVVGEEDEVESQLRKIEERLGIHTRRLEETRQERQRRTHDHIEKITRTCEYAQEVRMEQEEELLRKAVEKGSALQTKRNAKQSFFQKIAQKAKVTLEKSQAKQTKMLQEVVRQEQTKITETDKKERDRQRALRRLVQTMKANLLRKAEQKLLRKQDQEENYCREVQLLEQLKNKVMEKHHRASDVVEAMEAQKKELMDIKIRNELELKRLREEAKTEPRSKERKMSQMSPPKKSPESSPA